MKKTLFCLSLITSVIATSTFASNDCINAISSRYSPEWQSLDLEYCDLAPSDMHEVVEFMATHPVDLLNLTGNPIGDEGITMLASIEKMPRNLFLGNTKITDSGLRRLQYSMGDIIALDLGGDSITDSAVPFITYSPSLQFLNLSNTAISMKSIKLLSNIPMLDTLMLAGDRLNDEAAAMLSKTQLSFIGMNDNEVTDKGATMLASMPTLSGIELGANHITIDGVKAIAKNNNIGWINLSYDKIKSDSIDVLSKRPTPETLMLDGNNLSDEDIGALSYANLLDLSLADNNITAKGMQSLARNGSAYFEQLFLSGNSGGDQGAMALAKMKHLTYLDLSYNNVGVQGVEALAKINSDFLMGRDYSLILDGNNIGDEGVIALSKAQNNYYNLSLIDCQISDAGALAIAANVTAGNLFINLNHITKTGLDALRQSSKIGYVYAVSNDELAKKALLKAKTQRSSKVFLQHTIERMCAKQHNRSCDVMLKQVALSK